MLVAVAARLRAKLQQAAMSKLALGKQPLTMTTVIT